MSGFFEQDPNEAIDYVQPITGDTVASATWTITPAATLGTPVNVSASSKVRVSGLTLGKEYALTVHITGASGQQFEASIAIRAVDR